MHTVAVLDNGSVFTWGVNDEGALGRQTEGPLWEKAEVRGGLSPPSNQPRTCVFATVALQHLCAAMQSVHGAISRVPSASSKSPVPSVCCLL